MRHRVKHRGFGRSPSHRHAMMRNMVTSLFEAERIETTDAKAKECRSLAERIITLGKRGDLHARRRALRIVRKPVVVKKVFTELAERFRERPGGYTRIIKLGRRWGDNANMSVLELLPAPPKPTAGKRPRRLRKGKKGEEAAPDETAAQETKQAETVKESAPRKEAKKAPEKKKAAPKKEAAEKAKAKAKPKKEAEKEKPAKAKKAAPKEKAEKKEAPKKKKG